MTSEPQPIIPDYDGACIRNLIPECIRVLLGEMPAPWLPRRVQGVKKIVLLVLDGFGAAQFDQNRSLMPTMSSFDARVIDSVAPTTTVTALTSIVTAQPPGVHGMIGHEMLLDNNELFNALRWTVNGVDVRDRIQPHKLQVQPAFAANQVPAITRLSFDGTGFTEAMFQDTPITGYAVASSLPIDVWNAAAGDDALIYAYYDGIDTAAHAYGFDEHYGAEIYATDRMVRDLIAGLPRDTALVVTSDHGQTHVGEGVVHLDEAITQRCWQYSGEGRFRWLHAHEGNAYEVQRMCEERYGDIAWVMSRDELLERRVLGGTPPDWLIRRLGDVALLAKRPVSIAHPHLKRRRHMICQHGSLTSAELHVPLLVHVV